MFFTIPSKSSEIRTNTPIGVKSILAVFFESKNGNAFLYKEELESVSITIDGKQVCRNLMILPFFTNSPLGGNNYKWQDVALEINLNVDLSEIKITTTGNNNDYNIVFVCSDKSIDEAKGFDFVETKKIRLKGVLSYEDAKRFLTKVKEEELAKFNQAEATYQEELNAYEQYQEALAAFNDYLQALEEYNEAKMIWDDWQEYNQLKYQWDEYQDWINDGSNGNEPEHPETEPQKPINECPKEEPTKPEEVLQPKEVDEPIEPEYPTELVVKLENNGQEFVYNFDFDESDINQCIEDIDVENTTLGRELSFVFDKEPIAMFCFPLFSVKGSSFIENAQAHLNFTLSGTDNEVFPPKTDLSIISANKKIPFRKALHYFDDKINRSATIVLNKNENYNTATFNNLKIGNIEMYMYFLYKKIV